MDTDQQVSSISTEDVSESDTQPLIEIPISIQVEQRGDFPGETTDMKRKQKQRQQFVKIESIDDITSTPNDGGLDQKQTAKVNHKYPGFILHLQTFQSIHTTYLIYS